VDGKLTRVFIPAIIIGVQAEEGAELEDVKLDLAFLDPDRHSALNDAGWRGAFDRASALVYEHSEPAGANLQVRCFSFSPMKVFNADEVDTEAMRTDIPADPGKPGRQRRCRADRGGDDAERAAERAGGSETGHIAAERRMTTTAEGVETSQQQKLLRALGCSEMQGYLFSAPKPAAEIEELLTRSSQARWRCLRAASAVRPRFPDPLRSLVLAQPALPGRGLRAKAAFGAGAEPVAELRRHVAERTFDTEF